MFQVQLYGILNIFINIHTKNIPVQATYFEYFHVVNVMYQWGIILLLRVMIKLSRDVVKLSASIWCWCCCVFPVYQALTRSKSQLHIYWHSFKFHVYADAFKNLMILWDPLSAKSSTFILSCALALHLESEGQGRIKSALHSTVTCLPYRALLQRPGLGWQNTLQPLFFRRPRTFFEVHLFKVRTRTFCWLDDILWHTISSRIFWRCIFLSDKFQSSVCLFF